MTETSKELLDQPSKPSLFEGLLLGRNDSVPKSQKKKNSSIENERGHALTTEISKSQVLGKVKDFLGVMAKANEKLELNAQGTSRSDYDIEVLNGNEQEYIEMDLLLGVADLQTRALLLCLLLASLSSIAVAMVLEATMICIDNSEWMRNGDYSPSRFQAQAEAVNLICGAKTQSNPENTVGVLTMGGKGVRVLVTPTSDLGKILACMHGLEIGGEMNLTAGIQVAQLALKHRQNKNQQQRIIVFAGSPVKYEKKSLEAIGRKLKKNSVSLDVVDFGEAEDGKSEKLEALVAAVNNNGSSHIVHVPSGPNALSDVLISTPIFTGDGDGGSGFAAAAAAAAAGGISGYDFGVDPNIDPELALALRVSMEEERARQEAAAKRAAEDAAKQEKGGEPASSSHDVTMAEPVSSSALAADEKRHDLTDDESALLEQALAMSMDDAMSGGGAIADADMSDATTTDDQELAMALQMSVQESAKDPSAQSDLSKVLEDQSFVSSILNSLPGVDPNDPSVKDLLASLQGQSEQKKSEDNQENKGDK